ncbi:testis-specific serine/threonine-protein kinase 1-like [Sarcoptes scabiei]|nr:testis-specific serine/threonine-protein kinase 1-like [Sarcoptes scabiei]
MIREIVMTSSNFRMITSLKKKYCLFDDLVVAIELESVTILESGRIDGTIAIVFFFSFFFSMKNLYSFKDEWMERFSDRFKIDLSQTEVKSNNSGLQKKRERKQQKKTDPKIQNSK